MLGLSHDTSIKKSKFLLTGSFVMFNFCKSYLQHGPMQAIWILESFLSSGL
jgi:hypothetical protein